MANERRLSQAAMDYYARPQSGSGGVTDYGYYVDPATGKVIQQIPGGGYAEYAPRADGSYLDNKDMWSLYDQSGNYQQDYAHTDDGLKESLGMFLAAVGGMQFLPGGAFSSAAGGGALGQNGAFLGEGVSSGIPAWDGAGMAGAGGGALGGAGAAGGTGTMPMLESFAPEMGSALKPFGASALGGMGGLLGPAATLAGAALGAKPQEQSATSERKLPDYLTGPVVQDLLPRTQGLLAQQMPTAQQYAGLLGQQGQGLMSITPAGNGFERFTRGRY